MKRYTLPAHLVEQARAFESGQAVPAEPRNAATVVLLRDGAGPEPEVYLMRRQTTMAFAGGFAVFPGGGVDPRDDDDSIAWAGPPVSRWAEWLGTDEGTARALVCAAVRETFEESGVLLAGPIGEPDSVVADTSTEDWEADRVALETRAVSMTDFLNRRGLVLRSDLLTPWAAWLTPIFEPKRYRTWFFAAQMPLGQLTRDVSSESSAVEWLPVGAAIEQADAGEMMMLPPTWMTCLDVSRYASVADVMAQQRSVQMFTPQAMEEDDRFVLSVPPQYTELVAGRYL